MQVILNGKIYTTQERVTLHDLIRELNYNVSNCAIAINMAIVPRSHYHKLWLNENDNIEIVSAFQGG